MKVFVALLILAAAGCGKPVESVPAAAVAESVPAAVVTSPMTEQELVYCAAMGRLQIEEAVRAKNPDSQTTASIKAGGSQVVLLPEANEFGATHLMIRQVEFYLPGGSSFIQMWGVYCKAGEPVGAKHLFLGQQIVEGTYLE